MHWPDRVASEWKSAWTLPPRSSAAPSSRPQSGRPLARSDVPKGKFNQHQMNEGASESIVKESKWVLARPRKVFNMTKYLAFKTTDYFKTYKNTQKSGSFLPPHSQVNDSDCRGWRSVCCLYSRSAGQNFSLLVLSHSSTTPYGEHIFLCALVFVWLQLVPGSLRPLAHT